MRSCTNRSENELPAINSVDEEPVGFNVTFSMISIASGQLVISHDCGESFAGEKAVNSCIEFLLALASLKSVSDIFFELRSDGELVFIHCRRRESRPTSHQCLQKDR